MYIWLGFVGVLYFDSTLPLSLSCADVVVSSWTLNDAFTRQHYSHTPFQQFKEPTSCLVVVLGLCVCRRSKGVQRNRSSCGHQ